ncbi:centriole, cilia and spindle-associated protein [Sphaeramia orbicularis]|uniref:Centriole, cilia and spindle-associated protein-like n=1 Tax=Sphaeramia orbicularis TaxID=375764 RepID=A0A673CA20_9TELE|nr:centriole, cilia and spindle-associated protein-like [Sphaeramia orbicularis]XP_029987092.1 centriole, cilia and spindle-associated protein-like [Sphaeramia orbicularis]XP_029987093.1 centriole, cilia and spindle-associated protein-like [Sphaeramia orbicularis]XP_029987094.1 centriole, cilia and spindle-associated protein-like [Sphaeramia orbicularis]XP_029987095.1 centriole, cilia and spindle-associated protein-like [Sphaeramia orbicularis]
MVTKRIRSEYMKKFKDPKWETYTKCYEEMLKYRLTRRLLEHSHNPWFWSGSDTDSDSGGRSPTPPNKNQVQAETTRLEGELEECEGARVDRQQQESIRSTVPVPRLPLPEEEDHVSAAHASQIDGAGETRVAEEEREEQRASSRGSKHREPDRDIGARPQGNKSFRQTWRNQRVRPAPTQQSKEDSKYGRHPFALYGSGEKDADISNRKTHNVGPAASTTEIHESALRAKTRRAVEREIQTQRAERRRAKSADLDKARTKIVQPEFNPWLTEYMRCFSARSR